MPRRKQIKYNLFRTLNNTAYAEDTHPESALDSGLPEFVQTPGLTLEIGCGYGEYTLALAKSNPHKKYIGADVKADRLYQGATLATQNLVHNCWFLRCRAEHLPRVIPRQTLEAIWITFPDPQPQKPKRRLTYPGFLEIYKDLLLPQGILHLKTDEVNLFEDSLEYLAQAGFVTESVCRDVYASDSHRGELAIYTRYERMFTAKGHLVYYVRARKGI